MTTTTSTIPTPDQLDKVIDAMRSIQTEGDRWNLAEQLAYLIPSGSSGFGEVIEAATHEGVLGKLKENTLRLYRDTAIRWPSDDRVPNVSFSAHREAMVIGNTKEAARMLADLAKNGGAAQVTVANVRAAARVKMGKPPVAPKTTTTTKAVDVLADLKGGAPELIAALTTSTSTTDLDKVQAGLNKAIAHVERLRAKAARKAAADAKKAPASKKAPATKAAPAAKKAAGDIRGL